jgi:hypothetical protein
VVGRERELAAVSAFLDSLPGDAGALLIEGEAGIGKTTIWFAALRDGSSSGRRRPRHRTIRGS